MAKRYFIKKLYTATEKNDRTYDRNQLWFIGKGGCVLLEQDIKITYFMKEYGYSRLSDTKRSLNSHIKDAEREMQSVWWNIECSIEEVEVDD